MRCPEKGLAEQSAWELSNSERPIPILNAGSGKDQHPTQALLDIYTLVRSFEEKGGLDGRTVTFCGDLLRGRTVRSLSYLLTNFNDIKQIFVAPKELQVPEDVIAILKEKGVKYEIHDDLKAAVKVSDAVYMTRIQDEWDASKGESAKIDTSRFKFGAEELALLGKDASSCIRCRAVTRSTPAVTTIRAQCTGARCATACGSVPRSSPRRSATNARSWTAATESVPCVGHEAR